jgi:bacillithiol biosynthesis cysteine-adding enzyme BshC
MSFQATRISYRQTQAFSKIALDYVEQSPQLKPFYEFRPELEGIRTAISQRNQFPVTARQTLVDVLQSQYEGISLPGKLKDNISSLLSPGTFTVTTAHQNNLFTGPLYFIYKILHAIRLADYLNDSIPANHFVPVFYIGSEDADREELNHIWLGGQKREWNMQQRGAVGRMIIDKALIELIDGMEGELAVLPFGSRIISMFREFYTEGRSLQEATFLFVNELFSSYGLVILLPDNASLKASMKDIFTDDLLSQTASLIVDRTAGQLESAGYKVQANPREINLFYLEGDIRQRIEKKDGHFKVAETNLSFSESELLLALDQHPDRFSPNVILRGLYQEMILPNIAFIGGAGETAYWLQLKELFNHYQVPFPVLLLRNSFMLVEDKWRRKLNKLGFKAEDFFSSEQELLNQWVRRESANATKLNGSIEQAQELYAAISQKAAAIDSTLQKHVAALQTSVIRKLSELEKKMLRAERRKFTDQQRQLHAIKSALFPANGLQERRENLAYYYSKWGDELIQALYRSSLPLQQEFTIIEELA